MSKSSSANSDLSDGGRRPVVPQVGRHSDPCRICAKSVFILERLNVGGRILHRTCFKCARCGTQLSLAGYYETEAGEYCCELCPDEENREEKQATLRAGRRLGSKETEEEEVDSGHSSDEEHEEGGEEEVGAKEPQEPHPTVEPVTVDPVKCSIDSTDPSSDVNANLHPADPTLEHSSNNNTKSSTICSDGGIDENDNSVSVDTCDVEKEIILDTSKLNINEVKEPKEVCDIVYPDDKNPFGDDDDELETNICDEDNATSFKSTVSRVEPSVEMEPDKPKDLNTSLNPFGSDCDSEPETVEKPPTDQTSQRSQTLNLLSATKKHHGSLNPFGSSDEDCSQGSISPSLSVRSNTRTRKKRRAPLPPGSLPSTPLRPADSPGAFPVPAPRTSLNPGAASSARLSTASLTPPAETAKRIKDENNMNRRSQILESIKNESFRGELPSIPSDPNLHHSDTSHSDSVSMNQSDCLSLMSSSTTTQSSGPSAAAGAEQSFSPMSPDKADEGQWRKKKGPAPPRPIPPRRAVRKLHRKAINQELEDIEIKQGEMERQGVKLEKTIREICDKSDKDGENRDSLGPEAEDLIIQLFDLVNEKNELFRRQTELIYMKKDNRLEEQHADLEYQIRILMSKPDGLKTEEERGKEEKLIKKLVEVVGLRNEIVDCLEMDRLRERDEDTAIEDHMSNYAAVKPEESNRKSLTKMLRIKKKKKKDKDDEKDIDTSELPDAEAEEKSSVKKKKSTKKKLLSYASKKLTFPH